MISPSSTDWATAEQELAVASVNPLGWSDATALGTIDGTSSNDSCARSSSAVYVVMTLLDSNRQPVSVMSAPETDLQQLPATMVELLAAVTQLSSYTPFPLFDNPTQLAPVRDLLARTAQQPALSASSRALHQSLQAYLEQETSRSARWQGLSEQQQQELQQHFYQQQQEQCSVVDTSVGDSNCGGSHQDEHSDTDSTPSTSETTGNLTTAEAVQQRQYRVATAELLLQLLLLIQELVSVSLGDRKLEVKLSSHLSNIGVDMAVSTAASALLQGLPGLSVVYMLCQEEASHAWISQSATPCTNNLFSHNVLCT